MILYLPSSIADELSVALWQLAKPQPQPDDTSRMFGAITALDGSTHLEVEDTFEIAIHPQASLGALATILQPWIDNGSLPADTLTNLASLVESKRGQRLIVWDAFPQLFKDMSKTYEQMVAAGLLEEPTP